MKKYLRYFQIYFPFLQNLRFSLQRKFRQFFHLLSEGDFAAVSLFTDVEDFLYVDIGANRGNTIQDVLQVKPNSKVIAFEPNPSIYKSLHRLYEQEANVVLHNCGLGEAEESRDFYIPQYKKYVFDGLASFDSDEASSWLKTRLFNYKEKHLNIIKEKCNVKKLDGFNLTPNFIKIDVQGYELSVLLGAKETLKKFTPVLLIETPQQEVFDYLEQFNYKSYYFKGNSFVSGKGKLNTFFITDEKMKEFLL